eukprot:gene31627-38220_t
MLQDFATEASWKGEVRSIIEASVDSNAGFVELKQVLIADDASRPSLTTWEEWQDPVLSPYITIVKSDSSSPHGHAFMLNRAIQQLPARYSKDILDTSFLVLGDVFLASARFLLPLAHTLHKYPHSLVYPNIDVLYTDDTSDSSGSVVPDSQTSKYPDAGILGVVPGDLDLVMGYDWALSPRWEKVTGSQRVAAPRSSNSYELLSPSVPPLFAITYNRYQTLGKFDERIVGASSLRYEIFEYALRNNLCSTKAGGNGGMEGGGIVKNVCSRAAQVFVNLNQDVEVGGVGSGGSQGEVDKVVMYISRKWMHSPPLSPPPPNVQTYKDLVYMARFLDRSLYAVDLPTDPLPFAPLQTSLTPQQGGGGDGRAYCGDFGGYIRGVYPGLGQEVAEVAGAWGGYVQTTLLAGAAAASNSRSDGQGWGNVLINEGGAGELTSLRERQEKLLAGSSWLLGGLKGENMKAHFVEPAPIGGKISIEDILGDFSDSVRQDLLCEDFNHNNYCRQHLPKPASADDANSAAYKQTLYGFCEAHKEVYVFACPKSCGYCENGKFCEDFFLRKCPQWAQEGKCDTEDPMYGKISEKCRKSCRVCVPDHDKKESMAKGEATKIVERDVSKKDEGDRKAVEEGNNIIDLRKIMEAAKKQAGVGDEVDPGLAHRLYLSGALPDHPLPVLEGVPPPPNACAPKVTSDGKLLDKVVVDMRYNPLLRSTTDASQGPPNPVKIFCGIYTYDKHHVNAIMTRNTWAKKCDGFVAFSTVTDPSIPSVFIEHEGEESYNNMWQKSRSIWKYIYAHYRDMYDFFLLGGDDMFYIVENYRAYLGSEEIQHEREMRNGLFIGRIFQPPKNNIFNSGGAGYTLDRKALQVLGSNLDSTKCYPHQVGFWEDVNVASCLQKSADIMPYDTRDELGRERFHPFTPGHHLDYRPPANGDDWYVKYNPNLKLGFECCSA